MRPQPKFKVGEIVLDDYFDESQNRVEGQYAIGEIIQVITPANFEHSGYYYSLEWTDGEGNGEEFSEKDVEEYRRKYIEFNEICRKELEANG